MPLDPDTIDCLDDVKKGKPRRFVMICKGVQIKSLVVYKKGSVERYKKQAKEEGKGQFYHGVIEGKGVDITFKLCRADGYEKPPGKELILKDFLNTEADMKFKPEYEIVDVLPEVGETDESEGSQGVGEQQETPPEAPPMPEAGTYTAEKLAAECKRLKAALYPQVKEAVVTHPDQKDAVIRLLGLADKHEKATEFASAIESYQELSALLANLPAAEKPDATTDDPATLFNERLKTLLPEVKAAAGTPAGDEAKLKVSEAGVLARKKDFDQASALLDQAEAALKKSAATKAGSTNGDPLASFNERLKVLLPEVKAASGTPAGDEAKLKVSEAGVLARKKDFAQANALLDQAEQILAQSTSAGVNLEAECKALKSAVYPQVKQTVTDNPNNKDEIVRLLGMANKHEQANEFGEAIEIYRQLRELINSIDSPLGRDDAKIANCIRSWQAALDQVAAEIDQLEASVRDDPDAVADDAADALQSIVAGFDQDLEGALAAVDEGDETEEALRIVAEYESYIAGSELISHAEENPYGVTVDIREPLVHVLTEIRASL